MIGSSGFAVALEGRYRIERELGRGGMATVYLAFEPRHERQVALKVLHEELAASLGAERFNQEIRIAGRLAHPHIVPLIDSGAAAGQLYYVTPYIRDGSLRDRLTARGTLPIDEALRITQEVGDALDFAHRQGFVHRDVKPENILFSDKHALLADFGVACALEANERMTTAGVTLGTPEYMSPEQAAGESDVGPGTDVYALACVLYEMLAGQPPLRGESPRATIAKHVTEAPPPIRVHRPDAGAALERALTRGLAKDPNERFRSIADLIAAVSDEGAAPRVGAPLASTRAIAVLPFVNASSDPENEYLSDGLTDELIDALSRVDGLRVVSRPSVFALKGRQLDARAIGATLGCSWVLEGTVRRAGPRLRVTARLASTSDGQTLWSERFDRTFEDVWAIEEELARTIVSTLRATALATLADPVPKRYTENVAAYRLYLQGRYEWNKRTPEGIDQAIARFNAAVAEDPRYAPAYAGLSDAYAIQLDYRSIPVDEGHRLANAYAQKAIALDDTLAEAHSSLAWTTFIHDWDWEASRRGFVRAIELNPAYATARQWYAFWLAAHGRLDEARSEAALAVELDPASVSIRRTMGHASYYARDYADARYHLRRAIAMHPTSEETHRVLGLSLAAQGDLAEAERVLREALRLPEVTPLTQSTLGYVLARAGKHAEARAIERDLTAASNRGYISPVCFALLALGLADHPTFFDYAERAFQERRGWVVYFRVNPILDPARGEPRFNDIVARLAF
jgi:serine/threonine-protein kinase